MQDHILKKAIDILEYGNILEQKTKGLTKYLVKKCTYIHKCSIHHRLFKNTEKIMLAV